MRSTGSRRLEQEENKSMNLKKLEAKLIDGDRQAIAKAMTLMESSRVEDRELADKLLLSLSSLKRKSVKLGISGIPGVGKSTFIEGLGQHILSKSTSSKVAVLSVDPSSPISGGSILGDRARMPHLTRDSRVFIRPSPNKTAAGGISEATQEASIILEAAGYSTILIETVGVGQAEFAVDRAVDLFILLHIFDLQ